MSQSQRKWKRLLGDTNLERKSRWLLGATVLLVMGSGFYVYARQTKYLAYDQLTQTGRMLVQPILREAHYHDRPEFTSEFGTPDLVGVSEERRQTQFLYRWILTQTIYPEREPSPEEQPILERFLSDDTLAEYFTNDSNENRFVYYSPIYLQPSCCQCHQSIEQLTLALGNAADARPVAEALADPDLKPGQLFGLLRIEMSSEKIEHGYHENRAWLFTLALGATTLIIVVSWLIVRYVVVRPVNHLKSVSDAIAAGHYNVRAEIQTGDEFEDLSVAFNRMLSNLIQMQERNRHLIQDFDQKIDELARANMELHQSNSMKAEFLPTMSHELRTPLNSVIGFSEALLQADNLTEKQYRWAANILESGQQLLMLINDILDLAKAESGKLLARPELLHLEPFCEQIAGLFRPQAAKKDIEVRLEVGPNLSELHQDAGKLRQILSNLISNAIKFTPEGGLITVKAFTDKDQLILIVSDTGVGIPPEEQEMVFQKFRQASRSSLTREQGGTGLGLSIVRELCKLLGGNITLQSELGRGSTFRVTVATQLKEDPLTAFEEPLPSGGFSNLQP